MASGRPAGFQREEGMIGPTPTIGKGISYRSQDMLEVIYDIE